MITLFSGIYVNVTKSQVNRIVMTGFFFCLKTF